MFVDELPFIYLVGQHVRNFKNNNGLFNFSCPICGDSEKDKLKARGYIYQKGAKYSYKCHNCGVSASFNYFLKQNFPSIFDEYRREYILARFGKKEQQPVVEKVIIPLVKAEIQLPRCDRLSRSHKAVQYLNSRQLPLSRFYYTANWKEFIGKYDLEKEKREPSIEGIVIPCMDMDKNLLGFQCRNLDNTSKLRYSTYQANPDHGVVYGLDHIDPKKPVYCVEGPFDSCFIDNCIAVLSSSLVSKTSHLELDFVYIFDNERRNQDIVKLIGGAIHQNKQVVIWPKNLPYKDINDMVLGGVDVQTIIKENTCQGIKAEIKYKSWLI